jgi:hypothetical protein
MKAKTFNQKLIQSLKTRKDIAIQGFRLNYKNKKFELLKIESRNISLKDKIILISSGFHGNEPAGPLTILKYANKIIDYCHKNGLKIIIYPLINPSGFEKNTRYNIDNDRGDAGNNDFMRYKLDNGTIIDDLGGSNKFKAWHWSSDEKFKTRLPKETKLLHRLLKKDPLKQVAAAIDLHQDPPVNNRKAVFTYQYSFENKNSLGGISEKVSKIIPILKNHKTDTGFVLQAKLKTDKNGFIVRHDGSITDLLYRLGVKHSITIETTTTAPSNKAVSVNLTWILNIIDLVK